MNSVFVSPHFPPNYHHFVTRLRQCGANVFGLADVPWESLNAELHRHLTEYYRVSNMHNYDELVRAMGYLTHKHGKLDHIDSLNEYWLETEARLRTDFNISGIKLDEVPSIRRKSRMKEMFQQAGVKTARGHLCRREEEVRNLIDEIGYPVVVKPDTGVGAAHTFMVRDSADFQKLRHEMPPGDCMVEEFVRGRIVTFDGLADAQGNVIFCGSLSYSKGVMEAVREDSDIYYTAIADVLPEVEKAGRATLGAFNVRARFFHFEFFHIDSGDVLGIEVNIRPPGGLTLDMYNYLFDFDCYRLWAEMIVHGASKPVSRRKGCVIYVGRKDRIRYAMSHEQVVDRFRPSLMHYERMSPVFATALGNEGYILRDDGDGPLLEAAEFIQRRTAIQGGRAHAAG